jgi:hypothetical protein
VSGEGSKPGDGEWRQTIGCDDCAEHGARYCKSHGEESQEPDETASLRAELDAARAALLAEGETQGRLRLELAKTEGDLDDSRTSLATQAAAHAEALREARREAWQDVIDGIEDDGDNLAVRDTLESWIERGSSTMPHATPPTPTPDPARCAKWLGEDTCNHLREDHGAMSHLFESPDPVEAMRARCEGIAETALKECEARLGRLARSDSPYPLFCAKRNIAAEIRNAIAALKDSGKQGDGR